MFVLTFDEAVELVCGAARADLEVLAEVRGLKTSLGCEVGFGKLYELTVRCFE